MQRYLRDMRASSDSKLLCASLEKEELTIWETENFSKVATIRPGFSGGAQRHIVDRSNHVVYSGTWEDGLTAFDYMSGTVLWRRKNLIGIQRVQISAAFPGSLFVALDAPDYRVDEPGVFSGVIEIETDTGKTVWVSEHGYDVYVHPAAPLLVIEDRRDEVIRLLDAERRQIGTTPMRNFAILDVAFQNGLVAIAEGAKATRVIDHTGAIVSENSPKNREPNCTAIAFDRDRVIVHDSWEGAYITVFDPLTGRTLNEYKSESPGFVCFVDQGSRFVDGSGRVFRSRDGELVAEIDLG